MDFSRTIYLTDDEEKDLGIEFQPPSQVEMKSIEAELREMADNIPVEYDAILDVPPKGFLVESLKKYQRKMIEETLSTAYAERTIVQHDELSTITIQECGDKVESLLVALGDTEVEFSGMKFHEASNSFAMQDRIWYLRKSVAHELARVIKGWNSIDIKPHLEDAFRPYEVQEGLYIRRVMKVAREFPQWEWRDVRKVASSITAPSPDLAGHQAAAAIDLRLMHIDKQPDDEGAFLDLGNKYPEGGVMSAIDCPYITQDQYRTRTLFAEGVRMGKFRILPTEDWHANMGDRGLGTEGRVTMNKAIYGPIESFDDDGSIVPLKRKLLNKRFLSVDQEKFLVEIARSHRSDNDYDAIRKELKKIK